MSPTRDRLSILWLSHLVPYPPKGGVLMRSHYLATELAARHDVDLLALNQSRLMEAYFGSNAAGLEVAREQLGPHFRRLRFIEGSHARSESDKRALAVKSLFSPIPYSIAWLQNSALEAAIRDYARRFHYDLVHIDTEGLAGYRGLLPDLPAVLDHHNVESHMMLRRAEKESNALKKLYFYQEGLRLRQFEKKQLPRFQGHITCSDVDGQRLRELCPGLSVETVPNPVRVDRGFQRKQKSAAGQRLLFIGGLDWYPNQDAIRHFLKDIWPRLKKLHPTVSLDVVGKNPSAELRELAANRDGVRLLGFVDDIQALYRDCDLFICPIRDGGGTKLKVLDAMAHAMPVVGYPEALEGIDVQPPEDCVRVSTATEFADAVATVLADPGRAQAMGESARKLVLRQYEVKSVGRILSDYYGTLATGQLPEAKLA